MYDKRLIPGPLGIVDISLLSFTEHILSLVPASFDQRGLAYDTIGIHWRGGENDTTVEIEELHRELENLYIHIFDGFAEKIGKYPLILHMPHNPEL